MNPVAGGEDTALRLNQDLIQVNKFKTIVELSGSLDDYEFEVASDLGSKFSATVDRVVVEGVERKLQLQKNRLETILSAEISRLEQTVAPEVERLSTLVRKDALLMAEISESLESADDNRWPKIRR